MKVTNPPGWLAYVRGRGDRSYYLPYLPYFVSGNAPSNLSDPRSVSSRMSTISGAHCLHSSIIAALAPLLLKKMAIQALAQPAITVLKWRIMPRGLWAWLRCRTNAPPAKDIELDNVMAQVMTWLDLAIIFGPQMPLLVPLVLMAVAGQRWSISVGLQRLGKRETKWDKSVPAVWSVVLSLVAQQALNVWLLGRGPMTGPPTPLAASSYRK